MTAPSQPGDKLREILRQHSKGRGPGPELHAPEAAAAALLNKEGTLPDAMALARLYRQQELVERLPEEEEPAVVAAPDASPPEPPPVVVEQGTQFAQSPPMSVAEVRVALKQLQEEFQAYDAYNIVERPPRVEPTLVAPEVDAEPELAREGLRALVAGVLILLVVGAFIWLALYGPLRAPNPTPTGNSTTTPASRGH